MDPKPKPRPLSVSEISSVVDSGSRWAWQLEAKLAGVYETAILQAYDGAASALETRALTAAAPPGWSKPNEDEIGDSLRRKYEQKADDSSTAIRVEAMRRVTKKGLELMHVNLEAVNPLLKGVIAGLGGNIEIADTTRRDVMRSIDESWQAGDSIPKTAAKIRATGAEISKARSLLIARTELIGAINAAAHALGTISNDYTPAGGAPLLKIWLTAEDERVRDTHVSAGDTYGAGSGIPLDAAFQVGDSAMQFPGDQNGSAEEVCNCRCLAGSTPVDGARVIAASRRAYEGPLVYLATAAGHVLAATPNHPILTLHGWVAAGLLREGDYLICRPLTDGMPRCRPDVDHVPPSIEKLFDALELAGARVERMSGAVVDLHGERPDGEVDIVRRLNPLSLGDDPALREPLRELSLVLAKREMRLARRDRALIGIGKPLAGSGAASSPLDAFVVEHKLDRAAIERETASDREFALASQISSGDARRILGAREPFRNPTRLRDRARDPSLAEAPVEGRRRDAELAADLCDAHPGLVEASCLVDTRVVDSGRSIGHVYNLETDRGAFFAGGILTANCALSYEEGDALTASIGGTMDGEIEFQGRTYRPTGALLASGLALYELGGDLPDAADGATILADLPDAVPSESVIENARAWTSVLCLEGVATCDNRMFGIDSWTWRTLPLTIAMQFELQPEHMGAIPVGRIDEIEKMPVAAAIAAGLMDDQDGGYASDAVAVVGHGVFDDSGIGDEAMRLIGDQIQRGVSADYAPSAIEVVEMPALDGQEFGNLMEICMAAELLSATIVSQPAFAGTTIMLDSMTAGVFPEAGGRSAAITRASIRLARVAPTMTAAAMDFSSHCMIACAPTSEEASAIAQPGGQPAGDLHVTLAYLPNPDGIDFDKLNAVVSKVAAEHKTITGRVGGAGYFAPAPPAGEKPGDAPNDSEPDADADDAPPAKEPKAAPPAKKAAAAAPPEPIADPETPADSTQDGPDGTNAPPSGDADPGPLHPHVALVDAPGLSAMRGALCSALDDAGVEYAQNHDFTPHVTLGYEASPGVPAMGVSGAPLTFGNLSVHQGAARRDHPFSDAEPPGMTASAAGLAPLEPPTEWFEDPELAEPTPLTIDDDGRIYGHLATWGQCHVGIRDACVQPPESELDYALFHLGHIKTAEGDLVPVGTFTMDTGHAPLAHADGRPVTMQQALAHYDNTGTAVADVRCGEDDHGIWFAGAIRPDLEASKVRALRAAQISGDWRKHSGHLEFCAGLAVNVPGYPVVRPRTALAASGDATALVAAGVDLRVAPLSALDVAAKRLALRERLEPGTLAAERASALARISA